MKAANNRNQRVLKSSIDTSHELVRFSEQTAFLEVNKKTAFGDTMFLMIQGSVNDSYKVKGSIAGQNGCVMTGTEVSLVLKKLGFEMNSKQLKQWIVS